MKHILMGVMIVLTLIGNIFVFGKSVHLSDKIVHMESETRALRTQNATLSQKVYTQDSLSQLSLLAQQLGFTKEAEPLYLDSQEYALVR